MGSMARSVCGMIAVLCAFGAFAPSPLLAKDDADKLKDENAKLRSQVSDLQGRVSDLQKKLQEASKNSRDRDADKQIASLQKQVSDLQKQLEDARKGSRDRDADRQIGSLQKQVSDLQKQLAEARKNDSAGDRKLLDQIGSLRKDNEDLKRQLDRAVREDRSDAALLRQIVELRRENDELRRQRDTRPLPRDREAWDRVALLEKQNNELRGQYNQLLKQYEAVMKDDKHDERELRRLLADSRDRLAVVEMKLRLESLRNVEVQFLPPPLEDAEGEATAVALARFVGDARPVKVAVLLPLCGESRLVSDVSAPSGAVRIVRQEDAGAGGKTVIRIWLEEGVLNAAWPGRARQKVKEYEQVLRQAVFVLYDEKGRVVSRVTFAPASKE